jgi:hypothetical protein
MAPVSNDIVGAGSGWTTLPVGAWPEKEKQQWLRKTKLCAYFARKGRCKAGAKCDFAHSADELQGAPDLYRTRMCAKGSGCEDPECAFAHSAEELRPNHTTFKTSLCKWYALGVCKNGDRCSYAHGAEELRTVPLKPPGLSLPVFPPRLFVDEAPLETKCETMKIQPMSQLIGEVVPLTLGKREEELQKEVQDLRRAVQALSAQCNQGKQQEQPVMKQVPDSDTRTSLRKCRHAAPFKPGTPLAKDAAPFQPTGFVSSMASSTDAGSGSDSAAGDSTPPIPASPPSELQDSA